MGRKSKYPPIIRNRVIAMYRNNMTAGSIADVTGIPKSTIYSLVTKAGIKRGYSVPRKYRHGEPECAISMYKEGLTIKQVAEALGIKKPTVTNWIRKAHVSRSISIPKKYKHGEIETALRYYTEGLSSAKISSIMGIEKSNIVIWVRRAGIARTQKQTSRGNKNHWKGGITKARKLHMGTGEYKQWRINVFQRDGYRCVQCSKVGGRLHAHHILSYNKYPELRLNIDNGITLCESCHCKVHHKHIGKTKVV